MIPATIVRRTNERGAYAVRDLSPDGARLVGTLDLYEGEQVKVSIELASVIDVAAEVTHVDRQRKVVQLAFRGVSPAALEQIQRSIADMLSRVKAEDRPVVVIAHPELAVSSALERDLARIGIAGRTVATLAEIAVDDATIGVIVAGAFGEAIGGVLEQLEREHATVRRIVLFGEQIEKIAHPAVRRVTSVLRTPWRFKGLARAFDLPSDDVVTTYDQLVALQVPPKR